MTKVIAAVLLLLLTVVMVAVFSDYILDFLAAVSLAIDDIGIIDIIKGVLP